MRICLGLEYFGAPFSGWQKQTNHDLTIQAELERALSKVAGGQLITTICAGRTDRGVHACQQVVHFDTDIKREDKAWVLGTNDYLPRDIRVLWAKPISEDFHARHFAITRSYRYVIYQAAIGSALWRQHSTWINYSLDLTAIQKGIEHLIGEHDFTSFRASGCQANTPVRKITSITITEQKPFIVLEFTANAFLYHMIRNIMGVLLQVGRGKQSPQWVKTVLDAKNRSVGANTAPAEGLYFIGPEYSDMYHLPKRPTMQNDSFLFMRR